MSLANYPAWNRNTTAQYWQHAFLVTGNKVKTDMTYNTWRGSLALQGVNEGFRQSGNITVEEPAVEKIA